MKISLNWLKKFVDLDGVLVEDLVELIGARLVEVEGVIDEREKYEGIYAVKVMSAEKVPETKLTLCKIDDGGVAKKIERDKDGLIEVVCGGPNVRVGMLAVWIAPGATVPSSFCEDAPFVIGARKMLGKFLSQGMLAGADELDFGDEHKTIAELSPDDAQAGTPLTEIFGLSDIILEIENKSLTHRPDCFGIIGFAREVAGILGQKFVEPEFLASAGSKHILGQEKIELKIKIEDADLCPRYEALVMHKKDKTGTKYLTQMQTLLARSGVRTIDPIVDMTNYLMLLTGQPLHAFDWDKLVEVGGKKTPEIVVRAAKDGEKMVLLDGREIEMSKNDILITSSGVPVALAGAMGGANTAIDGDTKRIIVESATFSLYNLRKTQMKHGIFSEAITRFTKGQPAGLTDPVVREFAREMAGELTPLALFDEYAKEDSVSVVKITTDEINRVLGTEYSYAQVEETLRNVGFVTEISCNHSNARRQGNPRKTSDENGAGAGPSSRAAATSSLPLSLQMAKSPQKSSSDFPSSYAEKPPSQTLIVTAPFWRTDIRIVEDAIEEVGRLLGYDGIVPSLPLHGTAGSDKLLELKMQVRSILAGAGANEVLTYSFVPGDLLEKVGQDVNNSYKIVNSISPDLQYVRQQLAPSLLVKAAENLKDGHGEFGLFEMNQVFLKSDGMNDEGVPVVNDNLAFCYTARDQKSCFYEAKLYIEYLMERLGVDGVRFDRVPDEGLPQCGAFYEPKRTAKIMVADKWVGVLGEVKKSVMAALKLPEGTAVVEVGLGGLMERIGTAKKDFKMSQYPSVERDLTLAVEEKVSYEKIYGEIEKILMERKLIFEVMPLTIYRAKGAKKLKISWHLKFADVEKTLTNQGIQGIMERLEKIGGGN